MPNLKTRGTLADHFYSFYSFKYFVLPASFFFYIFVFASSSNIRKLIQVTGTDHLGNEIH